MIVITGGIGAGKSTVLKELAASGASCADADEVVHGLYRPGTPLLAQIVQHFGEEILTSDGALDRPRLGRLIFNNPQEVAWLNQQIHPLVQGELQRLDQESQGKLYAAIPLWYECGWGEKASPMAQTPVVAVWCSAATQHQRLLARGWTDEDIAARLANQLSMDEKAGRANYVIISDCTMEEMRRQIAQLRNVLG